MELHKYRNQDADIYQSAEIFGMPIGGLRPKCSDRLGQFRLIPIFTSGDADIGVAGRLRQL